MIGNTLRITENGVNKDVDLSPVANAGVTSVGGATGAIALGATSGLSVSGSTLDATAGGDVTGSLNTTAIAKIQGNPVATPILGVADNNKVLKWNGTSWVADTDNNTMYSAGTGISISGSAITNTGDTNASDDITNLSTADGDITGTFSALQIKAGAIGNNELASGAITVGKMSSAGSTDANKVLTTNTSGTPQWENKSNFASSTLTTGRILVGNASNQAQEQVLSGDATMNSAGVLTILNNSITTNKINPGAVTSTQIQDATVATVDLAPMRLQMVRLGTEPLLVKRSVR